MLTFKQSVVLLVSIITILAIVAIVTGLSPLYWPHPKTSSNENRSSLIRIASNSSTKTTSMTTRIRAVTKKKLQLTTVNITSTLSMTSDLIPANISVVQ